MARSNRPNSIYEPRRERFHPGTVRRVVITTVIVALVAGILGGIWWFRSGDEAGTFGGSTPTSDPAVGEIYLTDEETRDITTEPYTGETKNVTVYLDGWSIATLGTTEVIVRSDITQAAARVELAPMSRDGIIELTKRNPLVVEQLLARLVTVDQDLACTVDGCRDSSGEIDPGILAEPATIPGWGASYAGWGVTAGVWGAVVPVPVDATVAYVTVPDWEGRAVQLEANDPDAVNEDGSPVVAIPGAGNGWGNDTFLIGAAFGTTFPISATWFGESAYPYAWTGLEWLGERVDAWDGAVTMGGLADRGALAAVDALNNSQLTYHSSPTTGCGTAVLCVPSTLTASVENTSRTTAKVCDTNGLSGQLVLIRGQYQVDLAHPTHLYGAWEGVLFEDFEGAGGRSVLEFSGQPPLVDGNVSFDQSTVVLLGANGQTVLVGGARNDRGPAEITELNVEALLGAGFSAC